MSPSLSLYKFFCGQVLQGVDPYNAWVTVSPCFPNLQWFRTICLFKLMSCPWLSSSTARSSCPSAEIQSTLRSWLASVGRPFVFPDVRSVTCSSYPPTPRKNKKTKRKTVVASQAASCNYGNLASILYTLAPWRRSKSWHQRCIYSIAIGYAKRSTGPEKMYIQICRKPATTTDNEQATHRVSTLPGLSDDSSLFSIFLFWSYFFPSRFA